MLTLKQERFIAAYFLYDQLNQVAQEAGISERQARRWLQSPLVVQAIEERRQEQRELLRNKLGECLELAVKVVEDVLFYASHPDEAKRDTVYLDPDRAFKYVALMLKYAQDQREIDALKLRIAQVEAQQQAVDGTITHLPERKSS